MGRWNERRFNELVGVPLGTMELKLMKLFKDVGMINTTELKKRLKTDNVPYSSLNSLVKKGFLLKDIDTRAKNNPTLYGITTKINVIFNQMDEEMESNVKTKKKYEPPKHIQDKINFWRNTGKIDKLPIEYVNWHKKNAIKELKTLEKQGYIVHKAWMKAHDTYDKVNGFEVIHAVIETPEGDIKKIYWTSFSNWMEVLSAGSGSWRPEEYKITSRVKLKTKKVPDEYVKFHLETAKKEVKKLEKQGFKIKNDWMSVETWSNGYPLYHVVLKTPQRKYIKLCWGDHQGWLRIYKTGHTEKWKYKFETRKFYGGWSKQGDYSGNICEKCLKEKNLKLYWFNIKETTEEQKKGKNRCAFCSFVFQ